MTYFTTMKKATSILASLLVLLLSCNGNVFESMANKESKEAKIEAIKIHLDHREYTGAIEVIETLEPQERASDEVAILEVAAALGTIGLSVWDVIEALVEELGDSGANNDELFQEVIDALLGVDVEARTVKFAVMRTSIQALMARQSTASMINNTACFVATMLLGATLVDTADAIDDIRTGYTSILTTPSSQICSVAEEIGSSVSRVGNLVPNISLVSQVMASCPFLATAGDEAISAKLLARMSTLISRADQGCDDAPAAVQVLPACATEAFGIGDLAVASDGNLANCEIATNCLESQCL